MIRCHSVSVNHVRWSIVYYFALVLLLQLEGFEIPVTIQPLVREVWSSHLFPGLRPGILVQCLQVCKCGVRPWFTSLCLRMDHSAARPASLVQTRWVRHLYWSYWHSHTHLCKYHLFLYAEYWGPGSCQPGVSESHQVNWQGRERLNEQIHRRFLSSPLLLTKHRRIFCDFKT